MSNIWDILSGGIDAFSSILGTAANLPEETALLWDKMKVPVIIIGSLFLIKELKIQ